MTSFFLLNEKLLYFIDDFNISYYLFLSEKLCKSIVAVNDIYITEVLLVFYKFQKQK